MATLTKKDLLEAIEDMPMDAQFCMVTSDGRIVEINKNDIKCDVERKTIGITC